MPARNRILFITIAFSAVLFVVCNSFARLCQVDLHAGRVRTVYTFAGIPFSTTEKSSALLSDAYAKINEPLPVPLWATTHEFGFSYSGSMRPSANEKALIILREICDDPRIDSASIREVLATTITLMDRGIDISVYPSDGSVLFYKRSPDDHEQQLAAVNLKRK